MAVVSKFGCATYALPAAVSWDILYICTVAMGAFVHLITISVFCVVWIFRVVLLFFSRRHAMDAAGSRLRTALLIHRNDQPNTYTLASVHPCATIIMLGSRVWSYDPGSAFVTIIRKKWHFVHSCSCLCINFVPFGYFGQSVLHVVRAHSSDG